MKISKVNFGANMIAVGTNSEYLKFIMSLENYFNKRDELLNNKPKVNYSSFGTGRFYGSEKMMYYIFATREDATKIVSYNENIKSNLRSMPTLKLYDVIKAVNKGLFDFETLTIEKLDHKNMHRFIKSSITNFLKKIL